LRALRLLHLIDNLIRHPQVFDIVALDVDFGYPPEAVAVGRCAHHFFESQVHPCIAGDEMAVQCFAALELDEHGVPLGRG